MVVKLTVLKQFEDIEDHSIHNVGDALSLTNLTRINKLVRYGVCEITSIEPEQTPSVDKVSFGDKEYDLELVKKALIEIGVSVASNAKLKGIGNALEKLTEEQINALEEALKPKEE